MKMKKAILSCLMLVAGLTASAQEQKGTTEYVFEPHWYVNIQPLGVQYTLGEVDFGDLLSYNVQAAVGREFNKVVGARLAINAWQSKAGSRIFNNDYKWKWNYIAPTVDVTFNISNLISGVNPNRLFTFGAFAGLGANIALVHSQVSVQTSHGAIVRQLSVILKLQMLISSMRILLLICGTAPRLVLSSRLV